MKKKTGTASKFTTTDTVAGYIIYNEDVGIQPDTAVTYSQGHQHFTAAQQVFTYYCQVLHVYYKT